MTASSLPHDPPALRVRDPLTITIFGASGDLTQRKLLPALFAMFHHGFLPEAFRIVAFARRDFTDESFRAAMEQAISKFSRLRAHPSEVRKFCTHITYHRGDIEGGQESFDQLYDRLQDTAQFPPNHLFYLSIKPDLFEPVLARLKSARLIRAPFARFWTRVVIEKPFGSDFASAVALNQAVRQHLDESQVYRIDHFLGKETVQNILSFRFANAIFEPLFNSHLVDHIQITAAETVGMESGRGAYYDATGAVRDMVQNHLLQLLCLVTMEPPAGLTADAIRNEKVKVLQSIVPPAPHEVAACAVRAQYTEGLVDGGPVPGYVQEERIDPRSRTESFVALRLQIANWRWAGVPIYLRTGKRMPLLSPTNAVGAGRMRQATQELVKAYIHGLPSAALDDVFELLAWNQRIGFFSSEIGPSTLFQAYKTVRNLEKQGKSRAEIGAVLKEKFGEKNPDIKVQ